MKPYEVPNNSDFIGREYECEQISKIAGSKSSEILIVYGRRRIGKTELLEQSLSDRNIIKFEGKEKQTEREQMRQVLYTLAEHAQEPLLKSVDPFNWQEVFQIIHRYIKEGVWTLYFEEVQWLANYEDTFVSDLKYAWDNYFRHNKDLLIVLCGSAPAFMINQVAHSKALYNRSQHEIALEQFTLVEAKQFMQNKSNKEVMDAYLTVGGVPLYLERLSTESSVFLSLCQNAFLKKSFFSEEYERVFISSMSDNPHYRDIIEYLSKRRYATRDDILKHLKLSSGGNITDLLKDLEICGFIIKYTPYNLAEDSLLSRYAIYDPYLQFYYKFIQPIKRAIQEGRYLKDPTAAIKTDQYVKWLGFAFERFCRRYHYIIADILRFSGVHYQSGTYFSRKTSKELPNFQIDLLFERDDNVITICEVRYTKNPMGSSVIGEFERKLANFPNPKNKTLHKVLISSNGAERSVVNQGYFDKIITLDDLFDAEHY